MVPSEAAQLALPQGHRHLKAQLGGVPMGVEEDEALGCWCMFAPRDDSWRSWWARLCGPPGTPYQDTILKVSITLNDSYIWRSPCIRFETPVFHPNVDGNGHIDCDLLEEHYSPAMAPFSKMLLAVLSLLADPMPDLACWPTDAGMQRCIRLCAEDRTSFDALARAQAVARAHPLTWSCAVHPQCDQPIRAWARFLAWVGGQMARQRCMPELIDVWAAHVMPFAMASTMMAGGLFADHIVEECIRRHRQIGAAKRREAEALHQRRRERADVVAEDLRTSARMECGVIAHGASLWHTTQHTIARTLILAGHRISQLDLSAKVCAALSEGRRASAADGTADGAERDGGTDGTDSAAVDIAVADALALFELDGLCRRCGQCNVDGYQRLTSEWIAINDWVKPAARVARQGRVK